MNWGPDRWRLYGLALREAGRALRESLSWGLSRIRMSSPSPTRLLFAPQDLRTADPTIATDIYSGFFAFAGRVDHDQRPFAVRLRPAEPGLGGVRSMVSAGFAICAPPAPRSPRPMRARWWTSSSSSRLGDRRTAHDTQIVARRLISFISQSPLILEGADHAFYQRFLRIVGNLVRDLERHLRAGALPAAAAHGRHRALLCGPLLRGAGEAAAPFVPASRPRTRSPDPRRWRPCQPQSRVFWWICCSICCRCGRCSPAGRSTRPRRCCARSTGCCRWCGCSGTATAPCRISTAWGSRPPTIWRRS